MQTASLPMGGMERARIDHLLGVGQNIPDWLFQIPFPVYARTAIRPRAFSTRDATLGLRFSLLTPRAAAHATPGAYRHPLRSGEASESVSSDLKQMLTPPFNYKWGEPFKGELQWAKQETEVSGTCSLRKQRTSVR